MIDPAGTHNPIHESSTGGKKESKPERYDLVPTEPLRKLAVLYGRGAEKYGHWNWSKGYEWSSSYAAAQRHMNQFWAGEDFDTETGSPHVLAAAFHMFALAQFMEEHPEFDDRPGRTDPYEEHLLSLGKMTAEKNPLIQDAGNEAESKFNDDLSFLHKYRRRGITEYIDIDYSVHEYYILKGAESTAEQVELVASILQKAIVCRDEIVSITVNGAPSLDGAWLIITTQSVTKHILISNPNGWVTDSQELFMTKDDDSVIRWYLDSEHVTYTSRQIALSILEKT